MHAVLITAHVAITVLRAVLITIHVTVAVLHAVLIAIHVTIAVWRAVLIAIHVTVAILHAVFPPVVALLLAHHGIGILPELFPHFRMLLQVLLQVAMILDEFLIVHEGRILTNLFRELRMAIEKAIEVRQLAPRHVEVTVLLLRRRLPGHIRIPVLRRGTGRLRSQRYRPYQGAKRQRCDPKMNCRTSDFHKTSWVKIMCTRVRGRYARARGEKCTVEAIGQTGAKPSGSKALATASEKPPRCFEGCN